MPSIKSILVPLDFGQTSSTATELAIELAQAFDAELILLHVCELPVYPYMEFMLSTNDLVSTIERGAALRLEEAKQLLQARVPRARSVLRMGVPWQEIIAAIEESRPDLVVMGTHGRKGVVHAVLGSVAEKIVRLSSVPVLTAHARG